VAIIASIVSAFDPKGFQEAQKGVATTQQKFDKFAKQTAIAFAGVTAAVTKFAMSAADDAEDAAKLANTLKNVVNATDEVTASTEDYISKMTLATGVADSDLRASLSRLVRSTKSVTEAQELQNLALNISAATGKDLGTVTNGLAKAYDGNVKALAKLGIPLGENAKNAQEFNKVQTKLNKALIEQQNALQQYGVKSKEYKKATENVNELQAESNALMQAGTDWATELGNQFGGALATKTDSAAGKIAIMKNSFAEAQETIGYVFLPLLAEVGNMLQGIVPFITENSDLIGKLMLGFMALAGAIVAANLAIKAYATITAVVKGATIAWTAAQAALNVAMTANPIGLIVAGIALLIAALVLAYKKFDWFRNFVDGIWDGLVTGFNFAKDAVIGAFTAIYNAGKVVFNKIADLWNNSLGKISFSVPDWIPAVGGNSWSFPKIPKLAKGGIVTKPTLALIGEAGAEAVVPLNRGGGMGNHYTININSALADPEGVARAVKRVIQDSERRAGQYGLAS
jgi:IS1 family transposase